MIDKDILIGDIVEKFPDKVHILLEAGMHCIGCPASLGESLEEACMVHGIDLQELLEVINKDEDSSEESSEK